jgi:hypothetical protein
MPAKAGIQKAQPSRWIPACAGMTMIECNAIVMTGRARFRDWRLSVECEPAGPPLDRESKQ